MTRVLDRLLRRKPKPAPTRVLRAPHAGDLVVVTGSTVSIQHPNHRADRETTVHAVIPIDPTKTLRRSTPPKR